MRRQGLAPRPVVLLAVITGVCLLGDSSLYALLPPHLDTFAVTPTAAGLILGINRYIRIVSNSAAGWVVGRIGVALPVGAAIVLAAATTFAYGSWPGFWPLFVAHGLWGVSWSFLRLGGYLVATDAGQQQAVGRYMGVWQSLSRAGSLLAVVAGGLLADAIGADRTLVLFGVLTLSAIVLMPLAGIPSDLGKTQHAIATPGAPIVADVARPQASPRLQIWTLYAEAAITWGLVAGLFMGTAGYFIREVADVGGIDLAGLVIGVSTLSGIVLGIRWIADLGLSPVLGHLSDRLGRPRVIMWALGLSAIAMLSVAGFPSLGVGVPMFAVVFTCGTALTVTLNASIAEVAPPNQRATILSRYSTWADVGSGTGVVVGLPLVAALGFGAAYGSAAAIVVAAGVGYWLVSRPH